MSYKVFISYCEEDTALAELLIMYINNEFDGDIITYGYSKNIRPGMRWKEDIRENLGNSQAIICLVTPASVSKPWVYIEWSAFWLADKNFYIFTTPGVSLDMLVEPMRDRNVCRITDEKSFKAFIKDLAIEAGQGFYPYENVESFTTRTKELLKRQYSKEYLRSNKYYVEELHHVNLPVRDVEESIKFYRDILLLQEIKRPFKFPGAWFGLPSGQHLHLVEDSSLPDRRGERKTMVIEPKKNHFALRVTTGIWKKIDDMIGCNDLRREPSPDPSLGITQIYTLDPDCHVIELTELTDEQQKLNIK
jgi:glyoxylase I family protein